MFQNIKCGPSTVDFQVISGGGIELPKKDLLIWKITFVIVITNSWVWYRLAMKSSISKILNLLELHFQIILNRNSELKGIKQIMTSFHSFRPHNMQYCLATERKSHSRGRDLRFPYFFWIGLKAFNLNSLFLSTKQWRTSFLPDKMIDRIRAWGWNGKMDDISQKVQAQQGVCWHEYCDEWMDNLASSLGIHIVKRNS